jgi:hypothetical protein
MTEPTDDELDELRQANGGKLNFVTLREFRTIARAALAKWATPPAGAGEPVAWLSVDCIGERYLCFTKPNDSDPARPLVFGDTTPQPTKAQAGAVPLTDEQWQRIADLTDSILTRATKDEIERVIGIKGGQHDAE